MVLTCHAGVKHSTQRARARDPSLSIVWFKDETELITGANQGYRQHRRFKVAPSGDLQVFNVRHSDAGRYTCRASNTAGYAMAAALLDVVTQEEMDEREKGTGRGGGDIGSGRRYREG